MASLFLKNGANLMRGFMKMVEKYCLPSYCKVYATSMFLKLVKMFCTITTILENKKKGILSVKIYKIPPYFTLCP